MNPDLLGSGLRIGLGMMPLSHPGRPDEADSLRLVHTALDAGVRLVDTADAYALDSSEVGHSERLVATALRTWGGDADAVLVATKGGHTRHGTEWALDGRPEHLRAACEASLRTLGVEAIGLYQLHRPDPEVPWEESVGALEELRTEGKVRLVGVSNADPDQIRAAAAITPLAAVQNELSPTFRSSLPEVAVCADLDIAFLAWSPLGGAGGAAELGTRQPEFARVAQAHDCSPQRVCLAWLLALSPVVVPIPGARRTETLLDSLAAVDLVLSTDELAALSVEAA